MRRLTHEFAVSRRAVWNIDALKQVLLDLSHGKCAYCEARLGTESKYVEVEHFEPKEQYEEKVLLWDNLLPSCKRCNGAKGAHDVLSEPIVNPFRDDPTDHLWMYKYFLKAHTPLGKSTIDTLNLNNYDRVVRARFEIGSAVHQAVEDALEALDRYRESETTLRRNRLTTRTSNLLSECCPSADYAATASTVLHGDPEYAALQTALVDEGLWTDEMEKLHRLSLAIVL